MFPVLADARHVVAVLAVFRSYPAAMATMLALTHDYGYDARRKDEHGKNSQTGAERGHASSQAVTYRL